MIVAAASAAARSAARAGVRAMGTAAASSRPKFETLLLQDAAEHVVRVSLNRPDKGNSMPRQFWVEIREAFSHIAEDADCRAVVLDGGTCKHFSAGLDVGDHVGLFTAAASGEFGDPARTAFRLRRFIQDYQESFNVIERCPQPVIAAMHGAVVGAGVDMACAADIRFASADAWFCVKEAEIGLAADVGTLQRFPKVIGNDSLARELALTARRMTAAEASSCGFLSRVLATREELEVVALETAARIAALSPVAVQGTKHNMNVSRDASVEDGLRYMAAWNSAMLQTGDIGEAATATMTGAVPSFSKL